jgi:hypothetical protein
LRKDGTIVLRGTDIVLEKKAAPRVSTVNASEVF